MTQDAVKRAIAEINSTIVMHPRFAHAYQGILNIIETANLTDMPFGATVTAPPGCGKTALVKTLSRAIPSSQLLGNDEIRSVSVAAEANASLGHFVSKLLKQLGYPAVIRASTLYDQTSIICDALRERNCIVLFLDEFQHVCRGNRTLSAAAILDWVKQLADAAGVVVVMLGTRELKPLNEMNDQLGSRAPAHFDLGEFQRNEEWVGLLRRFAADVKAIDLAPLQMELYKPLHTATNGVLRPLKQLLVMSVKVALQAGKDQIDLVSLHDGYQMLYGTSARRSNPFES